MQLLDRDALGITFMRCKEYDMRVTVTKHIFFPYLIYLRLLWIIVATIIIAIVIRRIQLHGQQFHFRSIIVVWTQFKDINIILGPYTKHLFHILYCHL